MGWKISIASPSVAAQTMLFVLADMSVAIVVGSSAQTNFSSGAGGIGPKEGLALKQKRLVQRSPLFRAAYSLVLPRYNLENSLAFTVQRSFTTAEACAAFVRSHADFVPASGELIVIESSSTGQCNSYLPNALIETVDIQQHQEVGCLTRYSIVAGNPWQSVP